MKILAAMLLMLVLGACQTQGPFERAGAKVDQSVQGARDVTKDVIDDVREGAANVGDDVKRRRRR